MDKSVRPVIAHALRVYHEGSETDMSFELLSRFEEEIRQQVADELREYFGDRDGYEVVDELTGWLVLMGQR